MALSAGSRLGPYEIEDALGAGGMGEVYRARDTRLDRAVAIKVLPAHLAGHPELRQRLEREARAISSLNHPHICALYDIGHQDGVDFLVMEFLEGETLARRLERGPLPMDQVLRFGVEIADALDRAHRRGVVHRDLKPGNVMITGAGAKLMDFGLAKAALGPAPGDLTASPTLSRPLTAHGAIVGTFQYMSPEQLEGREADARSDIFALGTVLYEMATGRRAFEARSHASLIAAILEHQPPPLSSVQPLAPPALDRIVGACLSKDPDQRIQTAHDVKLQLEWVAEGGSQAGVPAPVARQRRSRERLAWGLAIVFLAAALVSTVGWVGRGAPEERMVHLSLANPLPSSDAHFDSCQLSPDGRRLALVAHDEATGERSLWVRDLDSPAARRLPGTEGAHLPFWSPDARFLGFFAGGRLKKIDVAAGPPQVLCDAPLPFGGAWSPGGAIVFAPRHGEGLHRIPAEGGSPTPLTRLAAGEEAHRWPSFLPDGRHFVFLADAPTTAGHNLRVGSLDSEDSRILFHAISNAVYAPPGYLLFVRAGSLVAQPFDAGRLRLQGDPFALADGLVQNFFNHRFEFSVSDGGMLLYRSADPNRQLTWVDRTGRPLEAIGEPIRLATFRLAPDGRRVAFDLLDEDGRIGDVWLLDPDRGVKSRLTFHRGADRLPTWSPDGERLAFTSGREGREGLYLTAVGRPADDELLLDSGDVETGSAVATSWSPDGRWILFEGGSPASGSDIWIASATEPGKAEPWLASSFSEWSARFSPDGRWVAYASEESGREEVYVRAFASPTQKVQVSSRGGANPHWRADGKELFYQNTGGKLVAVEIREVASGLEVGRPEELFQLPGDGFAPAAEGQRFLVDALLEDPTASPLTAVLGWTRGLGRE